MNASQSTQVRHHHASEPMYVKVSDDEARVVNVHVKRQNRDTNFRQPT